MTIQQFKDFLENLAQDCEKNGNNDGAYYYRSAIALLPKEEESLEKEILREQIKNLQACLDNYGSSSATYALIAQSIADLKKQLNEE